MHQALRTWSQASETEIGLFNLEVFRQSIPSEASRSQRRKAGYYKLEGLIAELGQAEPMHAELLMQRFSEKERINRIAAKRGISIDHVNRLQRFAIQNLTALLSERETSVLAEKRERILAKLPPASYATLVGRKPLVSKVCELLKTQKGPRIVELVGLGGVGKTAIANSVADLLAGQDAIDDLIWVDANQGDKGAQLLEKLSEGLSTSLEPTYQSKTSLKRKLNSRRYLIVLDSLSEQLSDLEWLHTLDTLSGISRFLLTGRSMPTELAPVYAIRVKELTRSHAISVADQQAKLLGIREKLTKQTKTQLYDATGGNPLAIKLAVGLLRELAKPNVLSSLTQGFSAKTEFLFEGIYSSIWRQLDRNSQALLLSTLSFIETGATLDQLRTVSELNKRQANDAVLSLSRFSLIELRTVSGVQKYGTHRLTRSFIDLKQANMRKTGDKQERALLHYWQAKVSTFGPKATVANEAEALIHAIRKGLSGKHSNLSIQLIRSLFPGLHQLHHLDQWLDIYKVAAKIETDPEKRANLFFQNGSLWLRAGKPFKAEECFQASIELSVSKELIFKGHIGIAMAKYQQKDGRAARSFIASQFANSSEANKLRLIYVLAAINTLEKQYFAANRKFASILKKRALLTAHAISQVHMNRALAQISLKKLRPALQQLRLASQVLPQTSQYESEHAQIELLRSFAFYRMQDLPKAEASLKRATEKLSEDTPIDRAFFETSLGRIHLANKKSAEATDFLKSAAKLWKKLGQPTLAADAASLLLLATSDDSAGS